MKKNAIMFLVNDSYVTPTIIAIKTFIENNLWFNGDIIIGYNDVIFPLNEFSKKRLRECYGNIVFHNIENKYEKIIEKFKSYARVSYYSNLFLKFHIFELVDYDCVLFLDSDIQVKKDIHNIFNQPYEGCIIGVTPDNVEYICGDKKRSDEAINSGVFAVYKDGLNAGLFNELLKFCENVQIEKEERWKGGNCEQDCLNLFFLNKEAYLFSSDYNRWPYAYYTTNEPIDKAKIIHFTGAKPWKRSVMNDFSKMYSEKYKNFIIVYRQYIEKVKEYIKLPKIMICGIGRLENRYIREWVEWYKNLGVDKICLYDNNFEGEEYFEEEIWDYIESGFVIIKNVRNIKTGKDDKQSIQTNSYNKCYEEYGKEFDWIGFFDIDEFLEIEDDCTLGEFLISEAYENYGMIKFNWKYFDNNDIIDSGEDYSINRFKRTVPILGQSSFTKFVLRGGYNSVYFRSAHDILSEENIRACNVLGEEENKEAQILKDSKVIHKTAWLNHYRFKTIKEYIELKQKRRWPDNHEDNGERLSLGMFFLYNEKTEEKINYINNKLSI